MTIIILYCAVCWLISIGMLWEFHTQKDKKADFSIIIAYLAVLIVAPVFVPILIGAKL